MHGRRRETNHHKRTPLSWKLRSRPTGEYPQMVKNTCFLCVPELNRFFSSTRFFKRSLLLPVQTQETPGSVPVTFKPSRGQAGPSSPHTVPRRRRKRHRTLFGRWLNQTPRDLAQRNTSQSTLRGTNAEQHAIEASLHIDSHICKRFVMFCISH